MSRPHYAPRDDKPCRVCVDFTKKFKEIDKKGIQNISVPEKPKECPVDAEELGRNTWSFLHTMAAYYPDKPSQNTQKDMEKFIDLFSRFYPCHICAEDLREELKTNRPDTQSRWSLSQWFCRLHNTVNKKLGKPEFDCRLVDERWLDGWKDGSCD